MNRANVERCLYLRLARPFSANSVVRELIQQAHEREEQVLGDYTRSTILLYLVGAMLECAPNRVKLGHNAFSTIYQRGSRVGDFRLGDVAIHVTPAPDEAVIARCKENLENGLRPMVVTLQGGWAVAEGLARYAGLVDRIDIFTIEQLFALHLYQVGKFTSAGFMTAIANLVNRYNAIVEEFETDPSLKIELFERGEIARARTH
jgi:hypothetical protein